MDFVDIGHRAVAFGERDDFTDRRDVAVHRIEALEHDQLGALGIGGGEQLLEMRDVVVAEDLPLAARAAHALDHRIVVERVGQDQAIRQQARDGGDAGEIGNPAGGEDERGFLAVQVGEFALEPDDRVMRAGNVAGAAGAGAMRAGRVDARLDHLGMAAHAEIVVRAPHRDFAGAGVLAVGRQRASGKRAASRSRLAKMR